MNSEEILRRALVEIEEGTDGAASIAADSLRQRVARALEEARAAKAAEIQAESIPEYGTVELTGTVGPTDVEIRMSALAAAALIHQRVPGNGAWHGEVINDAREFERWIRGGQRDS